MELGVSCSALGNKDLLDRFTKGQITEKELSAKWENRAQTIKCTDFEHLAKKLCRANGFTKQKVNTSGSYLPFDDPRMEE